MGSVGLSEKDWSVSPQYWIDRYSSKPPEYVPSKSWRVLRLNAENHLGLRLVT